MAYGLLMLLVVLAACGDPVASPPLPAPRARDPDAGESASPRFDVARPPPGVPDDGKTSGLVLLEVRGSAPCGAALIASNVALVPASCVLRSACRAVAPEALVLRSGDTSREVLPGAREIIAADPCERDALAAIVLDGQADGLAPFAPRGHPAAAGEHVRVVSFTAERPHLRLLRDHVTFREAERAVATLDAEGCGALPGAVAIDEGSGELVGLSAPVVGTYLVHRRLAMLGDGIGHVALTGVAVGWLVGSLANLTPIDRFAVPGAIVASVAAAVVIELVRRSGRTSADVVLALLFYGGIAAGVVLIGLAWGSSTQLNS